MAGDILKQVSKNLGKTKKTTDYTVKRVNKNFPIVERLRDSFDIETSFKMEFYTSENTDNIRIYITFYPAFEFVC